jgi:hypothetical protein
MSCSNVCTGAPLLMEANCVSGSDVVSANRFESTNSSRSVCPEANSWIILGATTLPAMQVLVRHQVYGT